MLTAQEAFDATNPDPAAYNLPPGHTPEDLQKARETAATNLLLGSRANDAYWDSRSELEALKAQATGHGVVTLGEDPTAVSAVADAETTAVDEGSAAPGIEQSTEDRLRAQLQAAGLTPEV